jgi:transposase
LDSAHQKETVEHKVHCVELQERHSLPNWSLQSLQMIEGVTEMSVKEKNPAEHAVQPELSQLRQFALHGWQAEPPAGR